MLFQSVEPPHRAVSESTAFLMSTMMADVINAGTATTARAAGFTLPAAGKTGTTNDYHDAWFVGFTPKLVTGVWVGYDQPKTIIGNGYAAHARGADVGAVHDQRDPRRRAGLVPAAGHDHVRDDLPSERQARDRRLPFARRWPMTRGT